MARVWIPPLLRELTDGRESVEATGATVGQLIEALDKEHEGLRARLCQGAALRSGLAVVVDGQVARLGLDEAVTANSEVHFLPAIAGG